MIFLTLMIKRRMFRLLIVIVIAYLIVVLLTFLFQRRLLYFPVKIPAGRAELIAAQRGFAPWKNAGGQIIGWKMASRETPVASVLIVHGNAGNALDRDYLAQPIHDTTNVDVFILEYPGYGARGGSPSRDSMVAAAEEAFQLLPSGKPVYVVSESIGTGVACELAKKHPQAVSGMALFVPYADLASVAQRHMWFLPVRFLLLDRFCPEQCLQSYHGPVKFVVAGKDEILGAETGKKLFERYAGPKKLEIIPNAHHNAVSEQSPDWWQEVFGFWHLY